MYLICGENNNCPLLRANNYLIFNDYAKLLLYTFVLREGTFAKII